MKTTEEIKADIDALVRKQGNQGALVLGDVLDEIADIVDVAQHGFQEVQNDFQKVNDTLDKFKSQITSVATFHTAVPSTATEIVFAFSGEVDLTGYTKSGTIGAGIDVYANGTKYAVLSSKIICAPENSTEFFKNYTALTTLNLFNFDTSKATSFKGMFSGCSGLTSLDVSKFDTSKATTFESMFEKCSGLTTLDLTNFDTKKVTSMRSTFYQCGSLTTIIANDWNTPFQSSYMFTGCTSLVGGNGTTYNSSYTSAQYAHIDVADKPGYFTAPA